MSLALLVRVSIADINDNCRGSKDCHGLGRLDRFGYCSKGHLGNLNKGIINTIKIKNNGTNMYNLVCHIEGTMHYIS